MMDAVTRLRSRKPRRGATVDWSSVTPEALASRVDRVLQQSGMRLGRAHRDGRLVWWVESRVEEINVEELWQLATSLRLLHPAEKLAYGVPLTEVDTARVDKPGGVRVEG